MSVPSDPSLAAGPTRFSGWRILVLATIALGAAQSPLGVALGASVGHLVATLIAVVGGALLSEKISERQVGITGGILFIVFAVATLAGVF